MLPPGLNFAHKPLNFIKLSGLGSYMKEMLNFYLQCTCKLYMFESTSSKAITSCRKAPNQNFKFYTKLN